MREVDVTAVLETPRADVEGALSPETIVEYEGTYEVEATTETDDGTAVSASADELEIVLEFTELENGYVYRQRNGVGPFETLHARVTVTETDDGWSRLSAHSEFTFGGLFSFLKDRLGAGHRQHELRRLVANLASDVTESGRDRPANDDAE